MSLSPRQQQTYDLVERKKEMTMTMVARELGISEENASRLLNDLVQKCLIRVSEAANATWYKPGRSIYNLVMCSQWKRGLFN